MTFWDCTMFNNELDMLELRLTEMQDYDVIHVLVESWVTHRGESKPLWFADNRERFDLWKDRIRHVAVGRSAFRPQAGPWEREHVQRNMAWPALNPEPDDLVLISDVDEIPSAAVMTAQPQAAVMLMQRVFAFAVDWEFPAPEPTGVLARADWLSGRSLAQVRDARGEYPVLEDAGWHFSWLGGPQAIREKMAVHCHLEYDAALEQRLAMSALYEHGLGVWGHDLRPVTVDETWPEYIRNCRCPETWFRPRQGE